jgi:pantoate--beta-alanine ligase
MQSDGNILSLHPIKLLRMKVFKNLASIKEVLEAKKKSGFSIGFVPTMGALHKGHLSLLKRAMEENEYTVISIFINPSQFNNNTDFEKYPRTEEEDLKMLSSFEGNVLVYIPEFQDVYPDGLKSEKFDFGGMENEMEGKFRPGHFDGVGSVLKAFFNTLQPDKSYFGEKDFQQLQIVKKLVAVENIPTEIVACPILREPTGLAMSSRNERLNEKQRGEASLIYNILKHVKEDFGTKNVTELYNWVENQFKNNEILDLEYFEITDEDTLKKISQKAPEKKYRAFIAVFAGEIRLIDNIALN